MMRPAQLIGQKEVRELSKKKAQLLMKNLPWLFFHWFLDQTYHLMAVGYNLKDHIFEIAENQINLKTTDMRSARRLLPETFW